MNNGIYEDLFKTLLKIKEYLDTAEQPVSKEFNPLWEVENEERSVGTQMFASNENIDSLLKSWESLFRL